MRKFVIERYIPGIGSFDDKQLKAASAKSNAALAELAPNIAWLHSYVTAEQTFCIYTATDESFIQKHSEMTGFPVSRLTEVVGKIDPSSEDVGMIDRSKRD